MVASIQGNGPIEWSRDTDDEGYRVYKVKYRVKCSSVADGPMTALTAPGLPRVGDPWVIGNDSDPWAWCRHKNTITPVVTGEPNSQFIIEFTFSNKPGKTCQDETIDNPLLQPMKISGSFLKFTEEITKDRFGLPVMNSAFEQLKGPTIEFDTICPVVRIDQNVADLQLPLLCQMQYTLNNAPLWGLPRRTIRFICVNWEKKYYGTCNAYYSRTMEFEIRYKGFDRDILDEGTKVLHGRWNISTGSWDLLNIGGVPPDPNNPQHFDKFKDKHGENTRVILNGAGLPANVTIGTLGTYMSIKADNQGNALTNEEYWIRVTNGIEWEPWYDRTNEPIYFGPGDDSYKKGEIVEYFNDLFIALVDAPTVAPLPTNPSWAQITSPFNPSQIGGANVVSPFYLSSKVRGDYAAETNYGLGDSVKDQTKTYAGSRHLEYYPESNFLLLGIPTSL